MATLLSAEREVSALSLRVPANYPDERFSDAQLPQAPDQSNTSLTEWRKQIIKYDQTRSLKSLHNFQGQIQIIEAEEDEIVPHETVQNYVNAISDKNQLDYHLMKGWPHSLGLDPQRNQQYQDMLLNWLNKI
jgi:esterase/lipase